MAWMGREKSQVKNFICSEEGNELEMREEGCVLKEGVWIRPVCVLFLFLCRCALSSWLGKTKNKSPGLLHNPLLISLGSMFAVLVRSNSLLQSFPDTSVSFSGLFINHYLWKNNVFTDTFLLVANVINSWSKKKKEREWEKVREGSDTILFFSIVELIKKFSLSCNTR